MAFYTAPSRAWEFAVGGLLALVGARSARWPRPATTTLALAGLGLIGFGSLRFDASTAFPGTAAFVPVIGAALLLVAGESTTVNPVSWLLGRRPAVWLGDVSYSWYLWHWPLIVFAAALVPEYSAQRSIAAALSLVPAWLAYRYLETPVRHRPASRRTTLSLGATCIVVPLLGVGVLGLGHDQLVRADTIGPFEFHIANEAKCDDAAPLGARSAGLCRWPAPGGAATGTAYLIGDSNAGHFSESFLAAAGQLGLDAVIAVHSSCPIVEFAQPIPGVQDQGCVDFVEGTLSALEAARPAVVVIASASDNDLAASERWPAGFEDAARRATFWGEGLTRVVERLGAVGTQVVLVHPVPRFSDWVPIRMAPLRIIGPRRFLDRRTSRVGALAFQASAKATEEAAATAGGARTLDVFDDLCPGDPCRTYRDGMWWFRDGTHISIDAARFLTPRFVEAMAA